MNRNDVAIEATADALLAVCALQTGDDPTAAFTRAQAAMLAVYNRAAKEQGAPPERLCRKHNGDQHAPENCWKKAGHPGLHSWEEL